MERQRLGDVVVRSSSAASDASEGVTDWLAEMTLGCSVGQGVCSETRSELSAEVHAVREARVVSRDVFLGSDWTILRYWLDAAQAVSLARRWWCRCVTRQASVVGVAAFVGAL